jgi:hypothetical protein
MRPRFPENAYELPLLPGLVFVESVHFPKFKDAVVGTRSAVADLYKEAAVILGKANAIMLFEGHDL